MLPLDAMDVVTGQRRPMVPPRFRGGSKDFEATGNEFFAYFKDLCGLQPEHKVLEIGCGTGRMAVPLTGYLTGSYDGIDINPAEIRWATKNIASRFPHIRFHLADLHNPLYNPHGTVKATEYRFPFADESFDFIFLTSVFTHMFKAEIENYLREIVRMLRPGATCLISMFLLNDESRRLIAAGSSSLDFPSMHEGTHINTRRNPAKAVAFEDSYIHALWGETGLQIVDVRYGAWCGRVNHLSYQDFVISKRS